MTDDDARDYKVGYKKPPLHTRFKKGQSSNPRGRPRGLADKLSRDCRRIVASDWYRHLFPTRLSPQRQAAPEFETTAQGCRLATSIGGVLTGRGADIIIIAVSLAAMTLTSQLVANSVRGLCS
jgi:hypothetical protein